MADKKSLTLTDEITSTVTRNGKNAGKTLYTYTSVDRLKYVSYEKFEAGAEYYFVSEKETEYNGNKQITRWISAKEYVPQNKDGKGFSPKQPDKVAILKESMIMAEYWIAHGFSTKPKSKDELTTLIKEAQEVVKELVK